MSFTLTIEPLGQEIEVLDGQTILDASLRSGIYLPHACCHGLCATCKVQLLDGEVDHGEATSFALMDFEREEGKCLACCAFLLSDAVIEADIDEEPDARILRVRDFPGVVSRIVDLTPTIKGVFVRLDDADGFEFQAGQYVMLHLPPGDQLTRPFSIANPPGQGDEIELNIRIVPGGMATGWIHESLRSGDKVTITGPYGRFFVRRSRQVPLLFMAGGSGLSSPRSMILDLLAETSGQAITLVYGARNRAELYYHDEFTALADRFERFTYLPVLSDEPAGSAWTGARGFVHENAATHFAGDFRGLNAYLCGPPLMIDACISALMQGRLFEQDIFVEKFISAADAQQVRSPFFKKF